MNMEKFREKRKTKEEEKEDVQLTIKLIGKKMIITVPKGTKVLEALKEANLQLDFRKFKLRLNGRELQRNEEEELENPVLTENSILVLVEMIKGGLQSNN